MKPKQLESIQQRHKSHIAAGQTSKPELGSYIRLAIVSGHPVKLKSNDKVLALCREKIAKVNYHDSDISIKELFESCPDYDAAIKKWNEDEALRLKRVALYLKQTEVLMHEAELIEDSDPIDITRELIAAARKCGIIT